MAVIDSFIFFDVLLQDFFPAIRYRASKGVNFLWHPNGIVISRIKDYHWKKYKDQNLLPISNFIGLNRRTIIATHSKNAEIIIGDNCGFSALVIGAKESIKIGNDVMAGANVLITDFDWHAINPEERRHGIPESKPIVISDNVFIGYSSTILKGVSIGKNSVIGANSVVTKNIPANVIAAGNPCRVIKTIS